MHEPLTNQNTAFLCERNYGKLSRLRAGRIIYITFSLRPARRLYDVTLIYAAYAKRKIQMACAAHAKIQNIQNSY